MALPNARVDRPPNTDDGDRDVDFFVYRFIPPISKVTGEPPRSLGLGSLAPSYTDDQLYDSATLEFRPALGSYLLDMGEPAFDEPNYHPLVVNLIGQGYEQGRVKQECLQQIAFPWGIDGTLPLQVYSNRIFRDDNRLPFNSQGMSRRDLQWEARRRGLQTRGTRSEIAERLRVHNAEHGPLRRQDAAAVEKQHAFCPLPLYRVKKVLPAVDPKDQRTLPQAKIDRGEVVMVYGSTNTTEGVEFHTRDVFGNRRRILKSNMEKLRLPFGLKLNTERWQQLTDVMRRSDRYEAALLEEKFRQANEEGGAGGA